MNEEEVDEAYEDALVRSHKISTAAYEKLDDKTEVGRNIFIADGTIAVFSKLARPYIHLKNETK